MNRVMRGIISVLSFLLLPVVLYAQAFDASEIVKRAKPWVVTIICYDASGHPYGQGSGFYISSGDLVTSHHVLAGAARAVVHDPNNNQMEILNIVADDPETDLVKAQTMMVREGAHNGIPLGTSLPEEGEEVIVIGSPKGLEFTTSEGIVSALRKSERVATAIQLTAATSPGSSGSPVLNMRGEVIGVVETKYGGAENVTFATPVSCLIALKDEQPTAFRTWSEGQHASETNEDSDSGNTELSRMKHLSQESSDKGKASFDQKDYSKAMGLFSDAIIDYASNGDAWYGSGLCFELSHDFEHAVEAFQNASELLPLNVEPMYHLGQALFLTGHYADAAKAGQSCLSLEPDNGYAWCAVARCYESLNEDTLAINAIDSAFKYAPTVAESHALLGTIYLKQRHYTLAEDEIDTAIKAERSPEYLIPLAEVYSLTDRSNESHKLLLESLQLLTREGADYADPRLFERLGGDLAHGGSFQEAIMTLHLGLAMDPRNAVMHHDLGSCFMDTGQPDVAIGELKQSIRDNPSLASSHFDLGCDELKYHHDKAAALEEYKILQKLDPQMADQLLNTIGK